MIPDDAPILSAAGMRAVEERAFRNGIAQDALMERAGAAVAREVRRLASGQPALILAGPGNNGGDAYVAARHLHAMGHPVTVAAMAPPAEGAAARMAAQWAGGTVPLHAAPRLPVLVDGLLGIGRPRPFDDAITGAVADLARNARQVVAIDLPSGLEADRGEQVTLPGRADVVLALGALKPAHVAGPQNAARHGHVLLDGIGLSCSSPWHTLARPRLRAPAAGAHKYDRGLVVVVAGEMPGAAALAATAALHGGAGYVVLASPAPLAGVPQARVQRTVDGPRALERLLDDARIASVVIGPGLGRSSAAGALLDVALATPHRIVLDADALWLLAERDARAALSRRGDTVLTPHAGEFTRLFGHADEGKIPQTIAAARSVAATVVHKGQDSVVATPDGTVVVAATASSWLSTAGTGDVLAGVVAARPVGQPAGAAAADALWLHAEAARRAGAAFSADELVRHLPAAIAACL